MWSISGRIVSFLGQNKMLFSRNDLDEWASASNHCEDLVLKI